MTRYAVQAAWDDAPHLSDKAKADLATAYPAYQRAARTQGVPQLGAGAIYPIAESEIVIDPIEIPKFWKWAYGLDVGWNRTAAIWLAYDSEHDVAYLTSEHYQGQAEPAVHAQAIRARGEWIPGVIDPAARGRGQKDGEQLYQNYLDLGLRLIPANNVVEAGIVNVLTRLATGRLKVFKTLSNWRAEFRLYRRDEKGHIVKEKDHLMDATRYLVMSGIDVAIFRPIEQLTGRSGFRADADPYAEFRGGR